MDHSVTRRKACRLAISAAGATLAAVVLPACSNSNSGMSGKARLNVGVRSDIVGFSGVIPTTANTTDSKSTSLTSWQAVLAMEAVRLHP